MAWSESKLGVDKEKLGSFDILSGSGASGGFKKRLLRLSCGEGVEGVPGKGVKAELRLDSGTSDMTMRDLKTFRT